ncbi:MAG: hypothetical protein N2689_00705 [Verrucomicrobiae bacterium]|nr:hypothetical protein [Verrucomicrobiae bacterium]
MKTGFFRFALGLTVAVCPCSWAAGQASPPSPPAGDTPPVRIRLLNGNELTGAVYGADAQGFWFNMQYGSKRYSWTDIDTNYLKQVAAPAYELMMLHKNPPASPATAAAPKPADRIAKPGVITIRLLDGTELTGNASNPDAKGFSFRTKYASNIRYNWTQVDTNHLKQVDADLYQAMVEKIREAAMRPNANTPVTIRLHDGTQLEGFVRTSTTDTEGFTFRMQGQSSTLHYTWDQLDINHLYQNNPALYQFMLQQRAADQITTDQQIVQFLSGKFTFRTEANKDLKNYGRVLTQLQGLIRSTASTGGNQRSAAQRAQQLGSLVSNNTTRATLVAFDRRVQELRSANPPLQNLLNTFHIAFDALLRNDFAKFQATYTYCLECLANF